MKTFKITSQKNYDGTKNLYQIERSDKVTPLRYLVFASSGEQAQEICNELSADIPAAVSKWDIDVSRK